MAGTFSKCLSCLGRPRKASHGWRTPGRIEGKDRKGEGAQIKSTATRTSLRPVSGWGARGGAAAGDAPKMAQCVADATQRALAAGFVSGFLAWIRSCVPAAGNGISTQWLEAQPEGAATASWPVSSAGVPGSQRPAWADSSATCPSSPRHRTTCPCGAMAPASRRSARQQDHILAEKTFRMTIHKVSQLYLTVPQSAMVPVGLDSSSKCNAVIFSLFLEDFVRCSVSEYFSGPGQERGQSRIVVFLITPGDSSRICPMPRQPRIEYENAI